MNGYDLSKKWEKLGDALFALSGIVFALLTVSAIFKLGSSLQKGESSPYASSYKPNNTIVVLLALVIAALGNCLLLFAGYIAKLICYTVANFSRKSEFKLQTMIAIKGILTDKEKPSSAEGDSDSDEEEIKDNNLNSMEEENEND